MVRTTVDLPPDLHELARQLAHERNRTMSEVIADLIRLGLRGDASDATTGPRDMPQVSVGRPITTEDVRSLDDDE